MIVPTTRRDVLVKTSALALAAVIGLPSATRAQNADIAELMKPSTLGDIAMGSADAPVTMVEYASMTCNHCAFFHRDVLPKLKERYVDTGKLRYILREYPLDPLSAGAFMLARCAGKDKYYPLVDTLFEQQNAWAFVKEPVPKLFAIAKQAGFTQESFEACLRDQSLLQGMEEIRDRAAKTFAVNSTPTFFVNGDRITGAQPLEEYEKLITKHLKS